MTPEQQAKKKVAEIFKALGLDADTRWVELVRGASVAKTSAPYGGTFTAEVTPDGGYDVFIGAKDGEHRATIAAGSFNPNAATTMGKLGAFHKSPGPKSEVLKKAPTLPPIVAHGVRYECVLLRGDTAVYQEVSSEVAESEDEVDAIPRLT